VTGLAEEVIADPVGLVVRLIGNVEKHLPAERVRDIVLMVVRARAGRRSLAQALHDDPSLLRTGRPPAPYCVAKLLMALHEARRPERRPAPLRQVRPRKRLRRQQQRWALGLFALLRQARCLRGMP
jgi:hypothetical protein